MTMLVDSSAIVADLVSGGEAPEINMMIGIGVVKESEAVLFHYIGNDEKPAALMTKAGKPLTRLGNVKLVDIDIVTGIGTENATKLNVILESNHGNRILVTSGIQTWWTTCVIAGLFGLLQNGLITTPFNLDSYRGNLGRKPIFASIRSGQVYSDQELYAMLKSDRTEKAWDSYESTVSSIVETLKKELNTAVVPDTSVEDVEVLVEETAGEEF
jgi:hypothetical protein